MEIKGGLKLIVLKILNEKDFIGYGLIKEIQNKTGFWKPSPGSIYPLMKDLLKKKLVTCRKRKNQKIYSITREGKIFYNKIKKKKEKIIEDLIGGIKFFEVLEEDKKELKRVSGLLKEFERGDSFLEENTETIVKLKINLIKALKKKKNNKKINKILEKASDELNKLK